MTIVQLFVTVCVALQVKKRLDTWQETLTDLQIQLALWALFVSLFHIGISQPAIAALCVSSVFTYCM